MSFGEQWRNAEQGDFDPPSASYHVKLIDASAFAGRDGREWAKVVLQIIGGEHAGRQFDHFMNLNNPTGLRIAKESLITYGLDDDDIDELDDLSRAMFELVGTEADVTVGHKEGFRNVNVQGSRTGESDVTPANGGAAEFSKPPPPVPAQQSFAAAAGTADNDDVPF